MGKHEKKVDLTKKGKHESVRQPTLGTGNAKHGKKGHTPSKKDK